MVKVLNRNVRGVRVQMPQGFIVGRSSKGKGRAEMMSINDLKALMGLSAAATTAQTAAAVNSGPTQTKLSGPFTVAGLAALTPAQGWTSFVTDATAPVFGAVVVGGGAVVIPVFYDGTNWIVA